jgi:hypothetical protein
MVRKARAEAAASDGDEACRRAVALHGGKLATSGHDGARQGAHKHRRVEADLVHARTKERRRTRHDGTAVHTSRGGALVGGGGVGRIRPPP